MKKANPNYLFLKKKVPNQRVTLLQGGTRSGKSFSVIYYLIDLCHKYGGIEIDICRNTFTALKSTAWKDFKSVLIKHDLYHKDLHNKTDKFYNLNGNIISYYGADDPAKIHGRARDVLWLNEANQLTETTVDQLLPRTRYKIIMDYNPAMPTEHWLDPYIDEYPPIITTYKDNPHLTKDQILDIESKKNNTYWWSVYGTGQRTKPTGVIFENWIESTFDESLPFIWGMDFGYVNDPTTLIKVAKEDNRLYVKEYLYEKGLSTDQIANMLSEITGPEETIIADNAEPRLIAELWDKGFKIYPCTKGKDSIRNGITQIQDYTMYVDPSSINVKKELNNYVWNTKNDNIINVPVDNWNHAMDALRYAFDELSNEPMYFG